MERDIFYRRVSVIETDRESVIDRVQCKLFVFSKETALRLKGYLRGTNYYSNAP